MTQFLVTDNLVVPCELAVKIGLNEAIVLQQLHFLLNTAEPMIHSYEEKEQKLWVKKSYSDWQKIFPFWSHSTIKKIFAKLREMKFVMAKDLSGEPWTQANCYTIDYEVLYNSIGGLD